MRHEGTCLHDVIGSKETTKGLESMGRKGILKEMNG